MTNALDAARRAYRDAKQVVWLCGAGLSVPSGVRAYRTGPNAIWGEHVLEWGTKARFLADPAAWWHRFWLGAHGDLFIDAQPNAGHLALVAAMARSTRDLVVTQNIDGLHRKAGHPDAQLVEIHGRHDRFCCTNDDCASPLLEQVDLSKVSQGEYPRCASCGAPVRPVVLLFDELYESHELYQARRAKRALNDADVVFFVGTSFSVGITSSAVRAAQYSGAKTFDVNPERSEFDFITWLEGGAEDVLPRIVG